MLKVREVENRVSEGNWRFHIHSMRQKSRYVKYVIADRGLKNKIAFAGD
jgi:hypothetical protein